MRTTEIVADKRLSRLQVTMLHFRHYFCVDKVLPNSRKCVFFGERNIFRKSHEKDLLNSAKEKSSVS